MGITLKAIFPDSGWFIIATLYSNISAATHVPFEIATAELNQVNDAFNIVNEVLKGLFALCPTSAQKLIAQSIIHIPASWPVH
jgi:hypothetical protein